MRIPILRRLRLKPRQAACCGNPQEPAALSRIREKFPVYLEQSAVPCRSLPLRVAGRSFRIIVKNGQLAPEGCVSREGGKRKLGICIGPRRAPGSHAHPQENGCPGCAAEAP